ncbi:MAG: hypothetical protein F7B95_03825 [Desulfurococcales archaeon]|nr:hypothetical protein [Desulfurococcales archaeon]
MPVEDIIGLISDLTNKIVAVAWALFLLTWSIGWTLRGSPVPFTRIKRVGTSLVEDSVWAAFWLAVGSTIFSLITKLVSMAVGG